MSEGKPDISQLAAQWRGTLVELLGIEFVELAPERVLATLAIRDDHARVQDQFLRRRPLRHGARRGDAASPRQADHGLADPRHRRVGPPVVPHDPDADGACVNVAFAGAFSVRMAERVRAHLDTPCELILADEAAIVRRMPEVDVLVTLAFTPEMGAAAQRLKLVQVPGAGLDRIDRTALPPGASLANVYGHEVGIAEYALGAMLALGRSFLRLDAALRRGAWESQWAVGVPAPPVWL